MPLPCDSVPWAAGCPPLQIAPPLAAPLGFLLFHQNPCEILKRRICFKHRPVCPQSLLHRCSRLVTCFEAHLLCAAHPKAADPKDTATSWIGFVLLSPSTQEELGRGGVFHCEHHWESRKGFSRHVKGAGKSGMRISGKAYRETVGQMANRSMGRGLGNLGGRGCASIAHLGSARSPACHGYHC